MADRNRMNVWEFLSENFFLVFIIILAIISALQGHRLWLLVPAIALCACSAGQTGREGEVSIGSGVRKITYEVVRIDGCEYLGRTKGVDSFVTHKGDCDNPIHCTNTLDR
jgi:hypothetical protein